MRWVEAAAQRPHHCAAIPFSGMHSPGGFIDTGLELPGWDPHVYISVAWITEAVKYLGWPTPADLENVTGQLAAARTELEQAQAEIEDLNAQIAAFGVLKRSKAIQEPRPPGRPKKNPEKAVA